MEKDNNRAPSDNAENEINDSRLLEALFFVSPDPVSVKFLLTYFPHRDEISLQGLIDELQIHYQDKGIQLLKIANGYAFRTAKDLSDKMILHKEAPKKLSKAVGEILAIIAYHQPITRAEMENIRGVSLSRSTLDHLLAAGWIIPKGRRKAPGKPVTWGTTPAFLDHFSLSSIDDLPGIDELKASGLMEESHAPMLAMRQKEIIDEENLPLQLDDIDLFE